MQAIILAAGMGRRLGELTKDNTKCMVPVNGVRLIDRLLGQLSQLSLNRVIIVVGYQGQKLINYIGHRYDDKLKIEYADNPIYDKTNNIYSLSLVKNQLMEDDTLLIESDLIFSDRLFSMILDNPYPNLALVAKYESWMDGTMVRLDGDNNIVNFVPKKAFKYDDVDHYYKTVNIYKFSKAFSQHKYVPFLEAYCHALGNNEYYEQVLRVITLLDNAELKALPIGSEKWYEIDDVQDLDIAETIFAEDEEMLRRFNYRYGGHWRFPKMLDYCYLVNPYFPTQQMKDELRSSFDTLLTEYPSGMFVNSLLAGKYFGIRQDYVVVGNGAAELIKSLMEDSDGKMGVIYPTFEEYPHRLRTENIVAFSPQNNNLKYTEDDLITFFSDKNIQSLLLINPDNPSGNFIGMEGLQKLIDWSRELGVRLIVDESFVDFSDDFEHNTLLSNDILSANPHLVVMKSISKSYGVPGLRLGVLASGDTELIKWVKKDISIWNINSFAEFYMQIFGKYENDYKKACRQFIAERRRFEVQLKQIPYMRVLPTQANYFCIELIDKYSSTELTKLLLARYNIMIKDCDSKNGLKGRNFIRVSVRSQEDNDQLIGALKELA
ncbi:Histidinol-phosphate/aromatic aminotransferase or cobyric acid decarboxylase [Prevotella sp. khp7]|uniref:aminotransferase class I/II-fold pyridoxal phosphate-dependent enzyme n=1 Tax=Prevotella sp. khp7 TaxID=1761885 RepID=UPI0008CDAAD4|nr:aminotransferase class I/II-fold pyridoxal phosphate-dependent enzyme [Prevotella sp. khp7]SEV99797.1 Histidinol-phosphate/aromatic aminotransferase or cobyric acid decarboxylase [Prevotella sp. khp7]